MKNFFLFFILCSSVMQLFAQSNQELIADYISKESKNNIVSRDLNEWIITDDYVDSRLDINYVYVQQMFHSVRVYNAISVFAIRNHKIAYFGPDYIQNIEPQNLNTSPVIPATSAISLASAWAGVTDAGPMNLISENKEKKQLYFSAPMLSNSPVLAELILTENKDSIYLAWNVSIDMKEGSHWWNIQVSAINGQIIDHNDYVVECGFDLPAQEDLELNSPLLMPPPPSASPSYLIFKLPLEAPSFGSRDTIFNPADPVASPFGWHDINGVAGAEYTTTKGNNTTTVEDADANNTGGASPSGGTNNDYNFSFDPTQAPTVNQNAALTNLFYMVNRCHDISYLHGFDEPAGNFQVNNYGHGGLGNDQVNADGLDGSGTNNANFSTPVDGISGRMQMYKFNYTTPNRDGDFDNGVIAHEFCHGISNRLTGGPSNSSCLSNGEQGGEGWSDWFALMLTIEPGDHGTDSRGIGTYVLGQPTNGAGIRRYPYSTNMSINPQTYATLATSSEVHNVGEIWCDAIWDMAWGLIDNSYFSNNQNDAAAGNNIAMKLVMTGMKLQPCGPGMLDARNAILKADSILYGYAHKCIIWTAFARRGMGVNALQGSASVAGDETQDFNIPAACYTTPPVASFSSPATGGCGNSIAFTNTSTLAQSSLWNFGDGTTSTFTSPSHIFSTPGVYSVKLKVTNILGADSVIHSITITSSFSVTANASPTSICPGNSSNLTSVVTGPANINYAISPMTYGLVSGTGTSVSLGDDATSSSLPIGFTFNFYGNNYSNFYICSNGFITFTSGQGSAYQPATIPTAAVPNNFIAFAWADLIPGLTGGFINYFTTGSAPNRKLVVNYHVFHYNSTSYPFYGQIVLNESSNTIEIHSTTITLMTGTNKTTQGVENSDGSRGIAVSGRNNTLFGATNSSYLFTPFTFYYNWMPGGSSQQNPIVTPATTTTYSVSVSDGSCTVTSTAPTVTVLPNQNWYTDFDGDGFGDPLSSATVNCFQPPGKVLNNTDCNDNNNLVWQNLSGYADVDSDGYTTGALLTICTGATLPAGYSASSLGTDCNDNNNLVWQNLSGYVDVDGDGYTTGTQLTICSGTSLPSGYSAGSLGNDCNDNNPAIHPGATEIVCDNTDSDCDGFSEPIPGNLSTSLIANTSATASWSSTGTGVTYDFEKRLSGSSTWDPGWSVTATNWQMTNMTPGTTYEWHVRTHCDATHLSNWTTPQPFTTTFVACGTLPVQQSTTNITSTSVKLHWAPMVPTPNYYTVRYRPSGTTTWTSLQGAGTATTRTLTGLASGTTYQWQIRSKCGTVSPFNYSAWTTSATFTTASTRLGNFTAENKILLFPNPASELVTIRIVSSENFKSLIQVTDMTGRIMITLVAEITEGENNFDLNIADLSSGMYIVCIKDATGACRMNSTLSKTE